VFSRGIEQLNLPVKKETFKKASNGRTVFEILYASNRHFCLVTRPIIEEDHLLFLVQIAASLRREDTSIHRLRDSLLWLIPITAVITSVVGWFLASLALRPIAKMIRQAQQISEARLHERIDVPHTDDEVEKLAATFNEMLSRFEQGFKRLRQFSAAASHELRTPLTVMKGEMELALRKPRMEQEYERVLRTQLQVVNDMSHVVEQLLAVAHAEDAELAVDWLPIALGPLIQSVVTHYQRIAGEKNITVEFNIPVQAIQVRGEKSLLERLVANLLENALKHAPVQGRVWIRLHSSVHQVIMTVEDNGTGILSNDMPKVFDKFFTHRDWSDKTQSTGIGLGLCRWIVEVHKGHIAVESPPGKGATFTVTFPSFNDI